MRHSKTTVAAGIVRTSAHGVRRTIIVAVIGVVAIWTAYAFAQEAYIAHKVSQQVVDLRRQNELVAAQNSGYHKDIQSVISGAADEEEARLNGYARTSERLYLLTAPPSPTPTTPPTAAAP